MGIHKVNWWPCKWKEKRYKDESQIKLAQQVYNQKSPFNETKKEGNSLVKVASRQYEVFRKQKEDQVIIHPLAIKNSNRWWATLLNTRRAEDN